MQRRDNECFERSFEACMFSCLLASLPLLWPFVFSLPHSPSLSLFRSHPTSGSAMNVAYGEEEMKRFLEEATQVSQVRSVLTLCTYINPFSHTHTRTHSGQALFHGLFSLCFQLTNTTSWHGCWLILCALLYFTECPGGLGAPEHS